MIEVSSKGKYPKESNRGNLLEICQKDFKNLRDRDCSAYISYLSTLITEYKKRGLNPELLKRQKLNLEKIRTLIDSGNEKMAFNNFIRTFPACIPYRGNGLRF